MATELLLNNVPIVWNHFPFAMLFALYYGVFSWGWLWFKGVVYYPFADPTLPWRVSTHAAHHHPHPYGTPSTPLPATPTATRALRHAHCASYPAVGRRARKALLSLVVHFGVFFPSTPHFNFGCRGSAVTVLHLPASHPCTRGVRSLELLLARHLFDLTSSPDKHTCHDCHLRGVGLLLRTLCDS